MELIVFGRFGVSLGGRKEKGLRRGSVHRQQLHHYVQITAVGLLQLWGPIIDREGAPGSSKAAK